MASTRPRRLPLLHPMEVGELLDETFDLYKRNFRLFFGITILISAPLSLVRIAVVNSPNAVLLALLDLAFIYLLTWGTVAQAGMERLLDRPVTIIGAYGTSARAYLRLFLGVITCLGLIAVVEGVCLLPGLLLRGVSEDLSTAVIALGVLFSLIPLALPLLWAMLLIPVTILEGRGPGALGRCRRLAAGNMWRLAVCSMGLLALSLVASLVGSSLVALVIPFTGVRPFLPSTPGNPVSLVTYAALAVVGSVVDSAWLPICGIVFTLLYVDVRIRREAYDLELLTAAIEARARAERGPTSSGSHAGESGR